MTTPGIVKTISGLATVTDHNGNSRPLQQGDTVHVNEIITTNNAADSVTVIEFSNGITIELPGNTTLVLDNETLGLNSDSEQQTLLAESTQEVAEIQQTLLDSPESDPTLSLQAPAAGAAAVATAENEGQNFVSVDYLLPTRTPDNGFETTGIDVAFPQLLEDLIYDPQTPPVSPTIKLNLNTSIQFIKEDSNDNVINLNISVDNPNTDILKTVTISQLPSEHDLTGLTSATGVSAFSGDGINTPLILTLESGVAEFSGFFTVSPLEDSDVDMTGISVSATATNAIIPTLQASASDFIDIIVDAVLDQQAKIDQEQEAFTNPSRRTQSLSLDLEFDMENAPFANSFAGNDDTDGSENVSSVKITIDKGPDNLDLSLKNYNGSASLIEDPLSNNSYTLENYSSLTDLESAINSLAINIPARYHGEISGKISTLTEDKNDNGGNEPDSSDNTIAGNFEFYALISDTPYDDTFEASNSNLTFPAQTTEIGFRTTGSTLNLDSADGQDSSFKLDFNQLFSIEHNNQTVLKSIDAINISGKNALQENNSLTLNVKDLLSFNDLNQEQLIIEGNSGDQVDLIDQDGPAGQGNWSISSHDALNHTNTYTYADNNSIIASVTIEDSLTVNL